MSAEPPPAIPLPSPDQLLGLVARSRCERLRNCDWLISTVGTSPATSCQAIAALKPKRVTLLHSTDTTRHAEAIRDMFRDSIANIELTLVSEMDANSIAELGTRKLPGAAVVDITGGTKVMSAAAFHLADFINARIVYSQGEYDTVTRKPKPDTERLLELPLAETIRSERRFQEGIRWLERGQFEAAQAAFGSVYTSGRRESASLLLSLSKLWSGLSALDRTKVSEALASPELDALFQSTTRSAAGAGAEDLRDHLLAVRSFAIGEDSGLCFAFALLAGLYGDTGRSEFASLLWYRLTEHSLDLLLRKIAPELNQNMVDWRALKHNDPDLVTRFHDEGRKAWGTGYQTSEPKKLNLTDRLRMLRAMSVTSVASLETKSVSELCSARNSSILAHGTRNVTDKDVNGIRRVAISLLNVVCASDEIPDRRKPFGERLHRIGISAIVRGLMTI